jgi:acetyl esterase
VASPGLADRQLDEWVAEQSEGDATFDVDAVRQRARERALARGAEPAVKHVRDLSIAGLGGRVGMRLYQPEGAAQQLIVFLHGGMWMLGDLETHDRLCRRLTNATGTRVLAVDFRRAPEHRWPAAVDDAEAAVAWAGAELDAAAPVLAGDSSGGHLVLLVALRSRACSGLLLACPNTDLRLESDSATELGHGWGLNVDSLRWAISNWLPPGISPASPEVSPVLADLTGLPPTVIVTADHDPLRDEGAALAAALERAAVPVVHRRERGMVHGFVQNLDLISPAAAEASARFLGDAKRLLERRLR